MHTKPFTDKTKEMTTITLKFNEILKDYPNMPSKDRAKKVNQLLTPLEKNLKSLKEDKMSLSSFTPDEKELLQAWKDSMVSCLEKRIELMKYFTVERDLTQDEILQARNVGEESLALANEEQQNLARFNEYLNSMK